MEIQSIQSLAGSGVNGVTDPNSLLRINNLGNERAKAEATADQMESVFFSMMVKAMRETVPEGGLLGKGLGGQTYVEMLDQQLTQMASLPRDPRFHETLVRQIMGTQGGAQTAIDQLASASKDDSAAASPTAQEIQ